MSIPKPSIGWVITVVVVAALAGPAVVFGTDLVVHGEKEVVEPPLAQVCARDDPGRVLRADCRATRYADSIQEYWQRELPRSFETPYRPAPTVIFKAGVLSRCGVVDYTTIAVYCYLDRQVYADVAAFAVLTSALDLQPTAFGEAFMLAHEYGHHIQELIGIGESVRNRRSGSRTYQVRFELQADCFAGVWVKHATEATGPDRQPLVPIVTAQDVKDAQQAAAALGDDSVSGAFGIPVTDESRFTHGSADQRQHWFTVGFEAGDPRSCDTYVGLPPP